MSALEERSEGDGVAIGVVDFGGAKDASVVGVGGGGAGAIGGAGSGDGESGDW